MKSIRTNWSTVLHKQRSKEKDGAVKMLTLTAGCYAVLNEDLMDIKKETGYEIPKAGDAQ